MFRVCIILNIRFSHWSLEMQIWYYSMKGLFPTLKPDCDARFCTDLGEQGCQGEKIKSKLQLRCWWCKNTVCTCAVVNQSGGRFFQVTMLWYLYLENKRCLINLTVTGRGGEPSRHWLWWHRRLPETAGPDQRDGGASPQTPWSLQGYRGQGVTPTRDLHPRMSLLISIPLAVTHCVCCSSAPQRDPALRPCRHREDLGGPGCGQWNGGLLLPHQWWGSFWWGGNRAEETRNKTVNPALMWTYYLEY